jgi:hypothetical protein
MRSSTRWFGPQLLWAGALAALALVVLSLGASSPTFAQGAPLTLTFGPGRDATQAGTVTLTPQGDKTLVVVQMAPNPAGTDQLNHIHSGHCPGVGPVVFPFNNIVNGMSTTTIDTPLSAIQDGNHSINIHQGTSAPASNIYTACVEIPALAGGAAAAAPAASARPAAAASASAAAPAGQTTTRPVPAGAPNTGVGPGPARSSAPASLAQVTVSAAPQLPSTGTGGLLNDEPAPFAPIPAAALIASLALLMGAGGLSLVRRRS